MLGINRTSVIPISRALQAERIILVRRGRIQILGVDRLRDRACEWYGVIAARFSTLG